MNVFRREQFVYKIRIMHNQTDNRVTDTFVPTKTKLNQTINTSIQSTASNQQHAQTLTQQQQLPTHH